jgi:outer membrane protein assembly factor BamD
MLFELFRRKWRSMTSVAIVTLLGLGLSGPAPASESILRLADSSQIADNAVDESADALASKQMEVARYLIGKLDYTAALNRLKIVVTTFQTTRYVEEALADLAEVYLALGIPAEAETAVAVLDRKFPNGPWSAKAQTALTSAGFRPIEDEKSWISQAFK